MILTKELIAKGLVGTTLVVAPTTLGVVYRKEIGQFLSSSNTQQAEGAAGNNDAAINALLEKVGLSCTFTGDNCEITSLGSDKTINVKHNDSTKEEGKTFTVSGSAKIKVQKNVDASESYNQNLKLTIIGGNITLTTTVSGSQTITQLEEFETYEIVTEGDKHYLSRKSTAIDEKSKALGLPMTAGSECKLPSNNNDTKTCSNITKEQLKAINFEGKGDADVTIENNETPSITLKITKTSDDTTYPNGGYKFVFETDKNISIPKSGTETISIKKETNTEFKIKKEGTSLTLEKAWDVSTLAGKIGFTTCTSSKECSFAGNTKFNLFISESDKVTDAKVATGKKIKYEEDQEGYFQGIKFTVDNDIDLTEGTDSSDKKIEAPGTNSVSYEIVEKNDSGTNKWFLSKKNS